MLLKVLILTSLLAFTVAQFNYCSLSSQNTLCLYKVLLHGLHSRNRSLASDYPQQMHATLRSHERDSSGQNRYFASAQ